KKADRESGTEVDVSLLKEPAEKALYQSIREALPEVEPFCAEGNYEAALKRLASLRDPVDRFFDSVLVMADDEKLKANRLALLQVLNNLFTRIADISCL